MAGERHTIPGDANLCDSQDKQAGIRWPIALDQRLDDLVARARSAGDRTNRKELLAALLLDSDPTGDDLREILRRYRVAAVRDAPLALPNSSDNVLEFRHHRPGPRVSGEGQA